MPVGIRTTAQASAEGRIIRRVDEGIALIEPNEAPLITFMNKMKKRKAINQTKTEWLEDDYTSRWGLNSGVSVAANVGSTTVSVADGSVFVANMLFVVPKVAGSGNTAPEVVRVASVAGNVLTVVRQVGGSGLDLIPANCPLRLIGTAFEEGGAIGTMKSTSPTTIFNHTQIFRTSIDFSKTNVAIDQYGTINSNDREREHAKKLKEHKIEMGAAFLWGRKSENLSGGATGKPLRTMGGLNEFVTTNQYDAGGTLNRKTFEAFSRQAFRYGPESKLLLACPLLISAISEWGNSWLMVKPMEKKLGVNVQEIQTGHGRWMLVKDWMLENFGGSAYGFGNMAFSLDMDQLEYRHLTNNGQNRDTHLSEDIVKDGRDAIVDEILTECTLKVGLEKTHAKLFNMTDYIA